MRQQIALRVVLLLQFFGRLNAGHAAEVALADDAQAEIFCFAQLLTLVRALRPFRADHDERRLAVTSSAAEPPRLNHERLRFLAAERRKFAGEDDNLIGERTFGRKLWRQHAPKMRRRE